MQRNHLIVLTAALGAAAAASLLVLRSSDAGVDLAPGPRGADDRPAITRSVAPADRSEVVTSSALGYVAPVGTRIRYAMQLRNTVQLGDAPPADLSLGGQLAITVVDRRGGEIVVGWRLNDPVIGVSDSQAAAGFRRSFADVLEAGFHVRITDRGAALAVAFPASVPPGHRVLLRAIVSAFQFVLPGSAEPAWSTLEVDPTGVANVGYRTIARSPRELRVARTRVRYAEQPELSVTGGAHGTFRGAVGWLAQVRLDESSELPIDELTVVLKHRLVGSLVLEGVGHATPQACTEDWSGIDDSADRDVAVRDAFAAEWSARTAALRVADVIDTLNGLASADPCDWIAIDEQLELIAKAVELRGDFLCALRSALADVTLPPRVAALLLGAIAQAGTDAAQSALAGMLDEAQGGSALRAAILDALFCVRAPSAAVGSSLCALLDREDPASETHAVATLLAGALAARGGDGSQPALARLLLAEPARQDTARLVVWLEALGNAGPAAPLERIRGVLGHADPSVRSAAVGALRKHPGPELTELLVAITGADADPDVRCRAVKALGERDVPPFVELERIARTESNAAVRRAALLGLLARRGADSNRALLIELANSDASADVRELARSALDR